MQNLIVKLYPHKLMANTAKCLLAAKLYNIQVELCNDFNYIHELVEDKAMIRLKKPLLLYGNETVSTTKAICFFFHRLKYRNYQEERICFSLQWIDWCESFEGCVQLLNKTKIISRLNELDVYLKKNKDRNRNFLNIKECKDKLSLADIFLYVSLKHSHIKICDKSWKFITEYIENVDKLKGVQAVMERVKSIYPQKNIYHLFISKFDEKNINEYIRNETYYVTTAINYVNGSPHIGHAYEVIIADVLARYNRNLGRSVYFTTGADEHGIKISNQAKKNNMTPIELCNMHVATFQKLNKQLEISEDYYVRTTSELHKSIVQKIWNILVKKGDIYLGEYEGWYNVREETYITENEAKLMNYVDPVSNVKLEKMKESSYFFKMNKYQDRLEKHIKDNPDFILPEQKRNEILQRLKEPLIDLSISRTNFTWGIPVPNDPKHVMYVWLDALLNYYSSCFIDSDKKEKEKFWPPNVCVIGKDIIWFHSVIFPTILMACDLPLPKHIVSHGFVLATDGKKLSKSLDNVIDPTQIIDKYGTDAFRYYMMKETKYGADVRFDIDNLIDMCNSDLADILGNLVNRVLALCTSTNECKIPPYFENLKNSVKVPFNILQFVNDIEFYVSDFQIQQCCEKCMYICKELNKGLTELEPWKLKDDNKNRKLHIIRIMLESIYFIAHYLDIFVPDIASNIFKKLNTPKKNIVDLSIWLDNLSEGQSVNNEGVLFKKIEVISPAIKMQKVVMKICKIIGISKIKENKKTCTICTIQVEAENENEDIENIYALLNLQLDETYLNTLTLAITNMKPIIVNNITVCAIIPHVNNSIFVFPESDKNHSIGTLINAKDYPILAKQRDKLTKKEITALDISVNSNSCFFDKVIPLIFSSTGKPLCHASIPTGCLKFF